MAYYSVEIVPVQLIFDEQLATFDASVLIVSFANSRRKLSTLSGSYGCGVWVAATISRDELLIDVLDVV